MPDPANYANEDEFMKVCVPAVVNEGKPQDQAIAQCMSIWRQKAEAPKRKSKIEVLGTIKKLIEKNGYNISDEELLKMFGVFNTVEHSKLCTFNIKLSADKEQIIKVLPNKSVYIEKYDEHTPLNEKLFDDMINNFNNPKLFKPFVDLEHQLGEKYADIVELFKKPDGLYAKIKLNEQGKLAIKENKYSYISPEWGDRTDTDGNKHPNVLWAITLTNIPALEGELPTLQDQIKLTKGGNMELSKRLDRLELKLGNIKLQEEGMIPPEILEAIQMIKEAIGKIDEITQQKDVAEEEAMKYKKELEEIENEVKQKEKDDFFKSVVENDQLEACEVEEWSKQYDISKDFVVKILTSRPKETKRLTTNYHKSELSSEDYKIGEDAGYNMDDPQEQKKYKKEVLDGIKVHKTNVEVD
jgi:hypothetical protein